MKKLLSLLALSAASMWATAFTASVTGNWSDAATWGGAGVPGNGDTVTINAGIVVTVDVNTTIGDSSAQVYSYISSISIGAAGTGGSGACTVTITPGSVPQGGATTGVCTLSSGGVATANLKFRGWYGSASTAATCAFSATGLSGSSCAVVWAQGGGTAAINFVSSNTNQLIIAQGVTLTVRGDIINQGLGSLNTADLIVCPSGGCTLKFDSSAATAYSDGKKPIYSFGPSGNNGYRSYNFACTAQNRCAITNDGMPADTFIAFSMHGFSTGGNFSAKYADLNYCGDSATYCFDIQGSGTFAGNWDSEHNTWDHCGVIRSNTSPSATITFKHLFNRHTNSSDMTCSLGCALNYRLDAANAGTWLLQNNAFDVPAAQNFQCVGCLISNNVFEKLPGFLSASSQANAWNSFDSNFVRKSANISSTEAISGPISNLYLMWDTDLGNPHGFYAASPMTSISITNAVVSLAGLSSVDSGNSFGTPTGGPSTTLALSISNVLTILSEDARTSGVVVDPNQGSGITNQISVSVMNSGMIVAGGDAAHIVEIAHCNILTNNFLTAFQNNYFYSTGTSTTNFLVLDSDNYPSNVCASAGSSSGSTYTSVMPTPSTTATNNFSFNLSTAGRAWLTNSGNGYIGMFSAVPGTNDQQGTDGRLPLAVGPGRRTEREFPTAYLGLVGSKGAWSGSGTYTFGDTVTDSNASVDHGNTILYRCINTTNCNGSNANSEPGIGSSWRTYWEWGVLQVARDAVVNNTMYVDGALPGCTSTAPCGFTRAVLAWVQRGHTPQNVTFVNGGAGGAYVGPVKPDLPHFFR